MENLGKPRKKAVPLAKNAVWRAHGMSWKSLGEIARAAKQEKDAAWRFEA